MRDSPPDTDFLLDRAAANDAAARDALLARHRPRLRRMVALRLDPRVAARVDPSDVVQDVLAEADRRLDAYLQRRPLPFYPWLRQFAADQLAELHRRHVRAARRSVGREVPGGLPDQSADELAGRLVAKGPGPSEAARWSERRDRVRAILLAMSAADREVLTLRYLEELTAAEVGAVLGVTAMAAQKRALRALERLRAALGQEEGGP